MCVVNLPCFRRVQCGATTFPSLNLHFKKARSPDFSRVQNFQRGIDFQITLAPESKAGFFLKFNIQKLFYWEDFQNYWQAHVLRHFENYDFSNKWDISLEFFVYLFLT